jgi:hypothetical protein
MENKTEAEREAQTRLLGIRARDEMCSIDAGSVGEQACKIDRRELLRLLDEARAEIARLTDLVSRQAKSLADTFGERGPDDPTAECIHGIHPNDCVTCNPLLRPPPEADVMERAHKVIADWRPDWPLGAIGDATKLVRILIGALTAHGDQRAREARDSLREQGYCMVCGVYHRVGACEAVENARREARAAAIEEAAQFKTLLQTLLAHGYAEECQECGIGQSKAWENAKNALYPPQSEGGEG